MERLFYNELLEWKNTNILTPLMVVGARQIGKTYLINEFCKNEFSDYIYINLQERNDIVNLFESELTYNQKMEKLELILKKEITKDTIIFFDEIQESESLIASLKAMCEDSFPYKIICCGSLLGVKLKRFSKSFPVGKVIIKEMHPMSFEEFLINTVGKNVVNEIYKCFNNNEKMVDSLHNELIDLYYKYLCIGGFPAIVNDFIYNNQKLISTNIIILDSIYQTYISDMTKYINSKLEGSKIEQVYNCIPSQLAKENKKFQYALIKKGGRKNAYETSIDWLLASRLIHPVYNITECAVPLKGTINNDIFKLYLNDVGLLSRILEIPFSKIVNDNDFRYKGVIAENYVVNELIANNYSLYYYFKAQTCEIDLMIDSETTPIPIEIKASDNTKSTSLNYYLKNNKTDIAYRFSTKNFGIKDNIKSVPLYAVFCLKKNYK